MAAFTALSIIGLGLGAFQAVQGFRAGKSAKKAGEQQQEAAESEAGLTDYNAQVADLQAGDAVARGAEEEQRFRAGVRGLVGAQRAAFAASNVDVGFGSALDVQADTAMLGELDALQIRTNAAREAWGYQVQAVDLRERARITRKEGENLAKTGREQQRQHQIGAIGSLVGTGASFLEARYGFGRTTGGGGRPVARLPRGS